MSTAASSTPDAYPLPVIGDITWAASPTIASGPLASRAGRYSAMGAPLNASGENTLAGTASAHASGQRRAHRQLSTQAGVSFAVPERPDPIAVSPALQRCDACRCDLGFVVGTYAAVAD